MILMKLVFFLVILILSFWLISSQDVGILSDQSLPLKLILIFIAGLFYTSFLTSPLAVVLFFALASTANIYLIAILGGIGAVLGDLLIVKIFRIIFKPFSFVTHLDFFKKFKQKLKALNLDLISLVLGIIIVASPFPDELGLALLGASRLSYFKLAIVTFISNVIGIAAILYTIKAVV